MARIPLCVDSIRLLQKEGIRKFEVRIADFYAGPDKDEESGENERAWRDRWTAAYNSACWARDYEANKTTGK